MGGREQIPFAVLITAEPALYIELVTLPRCDQGGTEG